MTWPKWVLIAWFSIGILLTISQVGKPRQPLAPTVAAVSTVISAGVIALVVIA